MAKKSTSPDKAAPRGGGRLAPEDAALWEQVARSATPLKRGKDRLSRDEPPAEEPSRRAQPPAPERRKRRAPIPAAQVAPPEPPKPPPANYDHREAKRLAAGRMELDARIDLHGMRQREAHRALNAFLAGAQARGHRHVLVITGKGRTRAQAEPASFIDEAAEPGVLRRAVPQWLEGDALRPIVVGYTQAGPRHGGEGAFYVRLRKAAH